MKKAKSTDAMNESTAILPPGMWTQARRGRRSGNWDATATRTSLLG